MARAKYKNRKTSKLNTLQEKGFAACAAGVVMLLLPVLVGNSDQFSGVAATISSYGWWAIALGVVFLGLHYLVKKTIQSKSEASQQTGNGSTKPKPRNRKAPAASTARTDPQWSEGSRTTAPLAAHESVAFGPGSLHQPPTIWSAGVFAAIEWRRFEAVCEALFAQAGFETKSQSHGADGGVDIWLHSRNAQGPVAVVQCKHWAGKPVGVKDLREFFGVMASHQLKRGTYATTSTYTPDAQQFAKTNGINAMDGERLLKLIATRTAEQQQALLDVALEGDYARPTCASCGVKMVERTPANAGTQFWGCSHYPRCKSRLPMLASLQA